MKHTKTNYTFRAKVLNTKLPKQLRQAQLKDYYVCQFLNGFLDYKDCPNWLKEEIENGVILEYNSYTDNLFTDCCLNGDYEALEEAKKINNAFYQRLKTLRSRVADILNNGDVLFLTLTFTNECLNDTTEQTRRKYVHRYLKKYSNLYVANIDYGAKKHREHYHALISTKQINLNEWNDKHGSIDMLHVPTNTEKDKTCLSKYIAKLSNHAIKETTKRAALIYSR